jgi:hypothetical protein
MQEPLTLSHKSLLEEKFRTLGLALSEYNFANLWLFRHVHRYELYFEEELFIKGISYDGTSYFMPTSDIRALRDDTLKRLLHETDCLFPIPDEWVGDLEKRGFSSSSLDADCDYCYTREKLATYPGRHLDGKRNLVHQFLSHYEVRQEKLSPDAFVILDEWNQRSHDGETDYEPCQEAIMDATALNLEGRVWYVDGKPAAFVIGGPLNRNTWLLQFAKADTRIRGIYPYCYSAYVQSLNPAYTWINLEQDLGHENLRKAKREYMPDRLLRKNRIS